MTLLFIGTTEIILVGGIALLLFGGKKLPEMMRGLGQGVREFKKGVREVEEEINKEEEDEQAEKGSKGQDSHSESDAIGHSPKEDGSR